MANREVVICIPHNYPSFGVPFTLSLVTLINEFYRNKHVLKEEYSLGFIRQSATDIEVMRNFIALNLVKMKPDYALFLDTDMTFPPNMIVSMLAHFEGNEKLEAVTGLYTWKRPPFLPHVYYKLNKETGKFKVACAFPLDKVFKVEGAGFGCIMLKPKVFKRIKYPYFKIVKKCGIIDYGEDLYFCKKAKMDMICDPRLACNHIEDVEFNINHYLAANGLTIENNHIVVTEKQREEIENKHRKV